MESSGEGPSTWKGCARRVPSGQGEEKPQEWRKVGQKLLHKFGIRMLRARVRVCVETGGGQERAPGCYTDAWELAACLP